MKKVLFLLCFILFAAPLPAKRPSEAQDIQAIKGHGKHWSKLYEAGKVNEMRPLYEPDAWLMTRGQPAHLARFGQYGTGCEGRGSAEAIIPPQACLGRN